MSIKAGLAAIQSGLSALAITLVVGLMVGYSRPAAAQWVVSDPMTELQTTIAALQSLQQTINQATQISNQITQINNQITQVNQGSTNLRPIPTNLTQSYIMSFSQLMQSLQNAQGLMSTVNGLQSRFQTQYPNFANTNPSFQQSQAYSQQWGQQNQQNVQDALTSGATVLANLKSSNSDLVSAQNSSQAAVGQLNAVQAGNQINAVMASQLQQMNGQTTLFQQAVLQKQAADTAQEQMSTQQLNNTVKDWSSKGQHAPVVDPLLNTPIGQ